MDNYNRKALQARATKKQIETDSFTAYADLS